MLWGLLFTTPKEEIEQKCYLLVNSSFLAMAMSECIDQNYINRFFVLFEHKQSLDKLQKLC